MSQKTFTYVGSSILKGTFKVRYANDATRVKALVRGGHTEVDFVELPRPMTKAEIAAGGFADKFTTAHVAKPATTMEKIKERAKKARAEAAVVTAILAVVTSPAEENKEETSSI